MQVEIKPCHVKMFPYYTSGKYQETYGQKQAPEVFFKKGVS